MIGIIKVKVDGNISWDAYGLLKNWNETEHLRCRYKIANYLLANYQNIENVIFDTEGDEINILE